MLHSLNTLAAVALMERATLLVNHVLASESMATLRLRPHAGRCIRVQATGWPDLLPVLPEIAFRITPAGLLEWCGQEPPTAVALQIDVDASNPARAALLALAGERPSIQVAGDAALANDVNWLFDNLHWDIEDDLEALLGPVAAQRLGELGRAIAGAVRLAAQSLAGVARGAEPVP